MISNEMHNLSAHVNFPDAHYQLPLLIMFKTDAEIQFDAYEKCKTYALNFFFQIQTTIGSFSGNTSKLRQDWLLCL